MNVKLKWNLGSCRTWDCKEKPYVTVRNILSCYEQRLYIFWFGRIFFFVVTYIFREPRFFTNRTSLSTPHSSSRTKLTSNPLFPFFRLLHFPAPQGLKKAFKKHFESIISAEKFTSSWKCLCQRKWSNLNNVSTPEFGTGTNRVQHYFASFQSDQRSYLLS